MSMQLHLLCSAELSISARINSQSHLISRIQINSPAIGYVKDSAEYSDKIYDAVHKQQSIT